MIRINLLAVERKPKKSFDIGQKVPIACSLIVLLTAVGIGWRFWSLRQESVRLDQEIVAAQQESQRLQAVLRQVDDFEKRKAQLQQRVALIEELRKGQSGPVHLLDEVSRSVPEMLWLTQLEQKGQDLTIEGRCMTLTSISDFVDNLARSGWFKKPVEIVDSHVEPGSAGSGELIRFTIKAQVASPAG